MTTQTGYDPLYEEIDLRQYIRVLIKNLHWIVGASVVCATVGLVVSVLLPKSYEASALVAVTQPRYVMQFDPRLETTEQLQTGYKMYPELAMSGDVLTTVMDKLPASAYEIETLEGLRGRLEASAGTDPSLIKLTVTSKDPEEAQAIANVWAEVFVARADALYGQGSEQADFFATQLARADAELEAAETALIEFQAQNDISILQNRLNSEVQTQSDYLSTRRSVTYLMQDVRNLQAQLAGQSSSYQVSLADQMTALFLQIKAFNAQASAPVQIQVGSAEALSNMTKAEQIAFFDDMLEILEEHAAATETRLDELEPVIMSMQGQLQEKRTEEQRLERARNLANETFMTLSRKVEESRIAAESEGDGVVIASRATVPAKASGAGKLMVTGVAGVLGGSLAVVAVLGLAWWREEEQSSEQTDLTVLQSPRTQDQQPDPAPALSTSHHR